MRLEPQSTSSVLLEQLHAVDAVHECVAAAAVGDWLQQGQAWRAVPVGAVLC